MATSFLDPTALALVIGGTLLAAVLRAPGRDLRHAVAALAALVRPAFRAEPLIEQAAALARIARKHGMVAVDRSVVTDPDLATAVEAIVDGEDPDEVVARLRDRRRARVERQLAAAEVWAGAAEAAPAMGMIGTLVGLARMFATMNDPAAIGGAMAVALLATLYGAVLANLVAQPIASRLRALARAEAFERSRLETPLADFARREQPSVKRARIAA